MPLENPTGGDAGASIQARLESFLAAEDSPEQDQQQARGNGDDDGDQYQGDDDQHHPDPDANADPDGQPEGDEPGDDQQPQMTTTDFAKVLGIDESVLDLDEEGGAIVKIKIDGKESTAKFADVLKSYQLQGHVDNEAREVAKQQKALQQRMAEADQAAAARIEKLEATIGLAQQRLMREFQSVDWASLRAQNPGEYSALYADFQARQAELDGMTRQAEAERTESQNKQLEQFRQFAMQERERITEFIPEWKSEETASKEKTEIKNWALKNGFEDQELQSIIRSPHVAALRKAMLYDRLQQAKPETEKRVRAAPKLVKAGQAQAQNREQQTVRNLRDNVRKSGGKTQDVAALLLATGRA